MFLSYVTWRTYGENAYSPWNIQSFSDTISADMPKRKNDLKFYRYSEGIQMWPVKMTGEVKKWPVKRHFWPVIVRWPSVILNPVLDTNRNCNLQIFFSAKIALQVARTNCLVWHGLYTYRLRWCRHQLSFHRFSLLLAIHVVLWKHEKRLHETKSWQN